VDSPDLHPDVHPAHDARDETDRIYALLAERDQAVKATLELLKSLGWRSRKDVAPIAAWLCDRERAARRRGIDDGLALAAQWCRDNPDNEGIVIAGALDDMRSSEPTADDLEWASCAPEKNKAKEGQK
jgi:hypothetical protein